MATSLAAQLQRLKAPQTSLLLQDKKRASLLFDPKEAANHDRQTIYDLGITGLEELKTLNARFSEFESTLFDLSSVSFERAVQSKETNLKLDSNIRRFFFLLSPYLLLKPAQKTLEWLVNRFHIHEYNVDDLLMLAFPYHESRIFIRIVQLVDLSSESHRWRWLEPLQKKGIPLSKNVLLNHASSSSFFLHLLCQTTVNAVKEHGQYAGVLSTLLAFFSTTLLGILDRCKRNPSESQMVDILFALNVGLKSSVLDFTAASFIIIGRLVASTYLSSQTLQRLVDRIAKVNHAELQTEKAMVLLLIYQRQKLDSFSVPSLALSRLVSQKNTASTFGLLAGKGYNVVPFLVPLLKAAIVTIQTKDADVSSSMFHFIESILNEVRFCENGAELVIRTFIETFDASKLGAASHKSATGKGNSQSEVTKWYARILQQLERSYPSTFDKAVCGALKGQGISQSQAGTLKQMLGFELQLDLFEKLHHSDSQIRAEALRCIAKQTKLLKVKDQQTLRDSLVDILKDDDPSVLLAALSFPVAALQHILSPCLLHSSLVKILQNNILKKESGSPWKQVVSKAIMTLTQMEKGNQMQELEALTTLLPHMIIDSKIARKVVKSSFGSRNSFLIRLKEAFQNSKDPDEVIFDMIVNKAEVVNMESVMEYGNKILLNSHNSGDCLKSMYVFLLLLASSVPNASTAKQSLEVLQLSSALVKGLTLSACTKGKEVSAVSLLQCLTSCNQNCFPLEGYLLVIQKIIERTDLSSWTGENSWIDLEDQHPTTKLLVQLYCTLSEGCASESRSVQSVYVTTLRQFFKTFFPSCQRQVEFLANFWSSHCVIGSSDNQLKELTLDIQVRSLRLGACLLGVNDISWAMVLSPDNIIFPSVLTALSCPLQPIRKAALDVLQVMTKTQPRQKSYHFLTSRLLESSEELSLDADQLQLVLYTSLSPDPAVQSLLPSGNTATDVLQSLLGVILNTKTPSYVVSTLLTFLTSVNSEEILKVLLPLVLRILSSFKDESLLSHHCSTILLNIVNRINSQTAKILQNELVWTVLTQLLENQQTVVLQEVGRNTCPAEIICSLITRELWEALPAPAAPLQQRLLSLLVSAGTEVENPSVLSAVARSFKQLTVDASLLVNELNKMKNVTATPANASQTRRRSAVSAPSPQILQTREWRCGTTLLELLQNKKKMTSVHLLFPVLFELLKKCLYFEEQAPVEYTKQLLLSCILNCCQKVAPDGVLVPSSTVPVQVLDVEAVVHCVRGTQNPQTHHHALLLLADMAALVPEQVLLNIMAIFTFMGSLVLRQDDAYSFQIISKIVDTIIPILIKASVSGTLSEAASNQLDTTIATIMRVFVDALLDIPEHRRLSLFHKLLNTLDPQCHLWLFLCLVMESHTVHHSEITNDSKKSRGSGADSEAPKRIEVALQIVSQFSPDVVLSNCVKLIYYLLSLPLEKDGENRRPAFQRTFAVQNLEKFKVKSLFDVDHHTPKQLRHYKYTIVTFLSALLSSLPFVNQVTNMDENETAVLVPVYMEFLEVVLALIQVSMKQSDSSIGTPTAKYWRVMVTQSYDILDKVNALLPSKLFLSVVKGLMTHEFPSLRRRAMELLNSRVSSSQREMFIASCDSEDLLSVLEPLVNVVVSIKICKSEEQHDEILLNQQTALLSIKYLAKYLAYDNHQKFKPILEKVTSLICQGQFENSNLLASIVLCAAELCSSLRAHAIAYLPVLMPAFIKIVESQITHSPDVVQVSLATSLYRIVESLAPFLSPYLHPLLVALSGLSAFHLHDEDDQVRASHVVTKLKGTWQKIALSIPTRVLLPAVENAYKDLTTSKQLDGIGPLMAVLAESFSTLVAADLAALQSSLTDFFLSALQFRSSCEDSLSIKQIDDVENHVIKSLVAFVLKLSETSFRPLYFKIFDWATRMKEHKSRTITFYRLSSGCAECLKALYVSFAGHILKNAAELLEQCNISNTMQEDNAGDPMEGELSRSRVQQRELYFGSGPVAEERCSTLLYSILKTLHYVFLYDSQNFLSKERFEVLMQPIVNQLENTLGGTECFRQRASEVLVPCLAQMAVACSDDTLWKQLNYQLLLKTRHANPLVRMVALEAVCSMARKLGESFLPLLPETVPFLAELLEDEEESIETACRRAVQDLEEVLGEPIQKYF